MESAREKLDLIHRLMHLSRAGGPPSLELTRQVAAREPSSRPPEVEDRIEEILERAREPMHITAIRNALVEMGVPLPGRGDEANLILRIRRDKARFVRTERGVYGLTGWHVSEYAPIRKKRKVRRRKPRKS
jgi:hypothetical protein